ncbi:MAG: ribokinase [Sporolactobacillus sp.]
MDIAVIGSNMVDLITYIDRLPKEGETIEAPNFEMGCGGKGANQAVAAAKMGSEVMMLTKVGDDMFGENTIQNLKRNGINIQYVEKVPHTSSGVAPIFVDHSSKNRILIIKGANQYLTEKDIERAAERLRSCSLIVLQLEIPVETVYYAIQFGHENGIPVILNPAPALKNLDFDRIKTCDYFMPNETELELITDMPVTTKEEITQAAKSLINKGLKNVVVTMGQSGVLWLNQNEQQFINAYSVEAADTTGAGDAFIGCFAHFIAQNTEDTLHALQMATAFAALSVTKRGTQSSYPTKEAVRTFVNENRAALS